MDITYLNVYCLFGVVLMTAVMGAPVTNGTSETQVEVELNASSLEISLILTELTMLRAEEYFNEMITMALEEVPVTSLIVIATTSGLSPIDENVAILADKCGEFLTILEALLTSVSEYIVWTRATDNTTLVQFQRSLQIYIISMMPEGTTAPEVVPEIPPTVGSWETLQILSGLNVRYSTVAQIIKSLRGCASS